MLIAQNYKNSNLIDEKIGSENSKNVEKKLFEKHITHARHNII